MAKLVEQAVENQRADAMQQRQIHLFADGSFYRAYEWSAWLCRVKCLLCAVCLLCCVLSVRAEEVSSDTIVFNAEEVSLVRTDSDMQLSFYLRATRLRRSDKELMVRLVPVLTDGSDSTVYPDILIFNTRSYVHHRTMALRNHPYDTASYMMNASSRRDTMAFYHATVPYAPWMERARLYLRHEESSGCAVREVEELPVSVTLTRADTLQHRDTSWVEQVIEPAGVYSNRLRVMFRLDSTRLDSTYLDNRSELARMDSDFMRIMNDSDFVITHVTFHGYASPDGSYRHNTELAYGRMRTLRDYIGSHYGVADSLIESSYTPENWRGFRDSLPEWTSPRVHRELTYIYNVVRDPDARMQAMKRHYPELMHRLRRDLFPHLRYTDYTIEYRRVRDKTVPEAYTVCHVDTVLPALPPDTLRPLPRRRPLFEVKTNLLFDAAMTPNIEIEVPIGYHPWSIMAEWWTPWYVFGKGNSPMGSGAYSLMMAGIELRYWFRRKCDWVQPVMNGHFLGLYGAGGFYDIETESNRKGWQGEYTSIGLTYGYVLPLAPFWNMEFSVSAGYVGGPQRYYKGMFDDTHLIWQDNRHFWYVGPTKLKISIGYMFNAREKKKVK